MFENPKKNRDGTSSKAGWWYMGKRDIRRMEVGFRSTQKRGERSAKK
jgi:hypothetical protein